MLRKSKQLGFTLIELLIVVLIVGILAAAALPAYQRSVERARFPEAQLILDAYRKALDIYVMENGVLPTSLDDLPLQIPAPQSFQGNNLSASGSSVSLEVVRKGYSWQSVMSGGTEFTKYFFRYTYYKDNPELNRIYCAGVYCSMLIPFSCKNQTQCFFNYGKNWTCQ